MALFLQFFERQVVGSAIKHKMPLIVGKKLFVAEEMPLLSPHGGHIEFMLLLFSLHIDDLDFVLFPLPP